MKIVLVFLLLAITCLSAVSIGPWQNIRYTNRQNATNFQLRTEISTGAALVNRVLYATGTEIAETNLTLSNPATSTFQASIAGANPRKYHGSNNLPVMDMPHLYPCIMQDQAFPALPISHPYPQTQPMTLLQTIWIS